MRPGFRPVVRSRLCRRPLAVSTLLDLAFAGAGRCEDHRPFVSGRHVVRCGLAEPTKLPQQLLSEGMPWRRPPEMREGAAGKKWPTIADHLVSIFRRRRTQGYFWRTSFAPDSLEQSATRIFGSLSFGGIALMRIAQRPVPEQIFEPVQVTAMRATCHDDRNDDQQCHAEPKHRLWLTSAAFRVNFSA